MNKSKPKDDDLERAFQNALRGNEHFPELIRQLCAGRLYFLVPHHPENEGEKEFTNTDRVPFIKVQGPDGRVFVPVYTKIRHARHAMKAMNQRYDFVEMQGRELFDVLANHRVNVAVNVRSGIGQIMMNDSTVAKIADGTILNPPLEGEQRGQIRSLDAADYPTGLVQPLFQYLRGRPEVRAGWIFQQTNPPPGKTAGYVFALLMTTESETVLNEFLLVGAASRQRDITFAVKPVKADDAVLAPVIRTVPPFFCAPDFHWPQSLETDKGTGERIKI